ncbi:MAG: metal-sensing transcriptional repressor [Nitrospinae bacterium]|nr:metal-sensing transcriptional repressor [Nitrospinota bacterium]
MDKHETHPEIVKRLKRALGHLDKVVHMIESGKACLQVAQQLQAVVNAIAKAKQIYVQDHIENCIETREGLASKDLARQVRELKEIAKYL